MLGSYAIQIIVGVIIAVAAGVIVRLIFSKRKKPEINLNIAPGATIGSIIISDKVVAVRYLDGMATQAPKVEHSQFRNYLEQGDKEFHSDNFKGATIFYNKAHAYAVKSGDKRLITLASFELGAALGMQNKYAEAEKYFNAVLKINPNFPGIYYNRGTLYNQKGEYDLAIEDLSRVIEHDQNNSWAYSHRGYAYIKKGEYDRAIKDLDRALKLNPKDVSAYYNRGATYFVKMEYSRSAKDYSRALKLNPKDATAYNNRGSAYGHIWKFNKATKDFEHAIELDPNFALAMQNLGTSYIVKSAITRKRLSSADREMASHWYKEALKNRNKLPDKGEYVLGLHKALSKFEK